MFMLSFRMKKAALLAGGFALVLVAALGIRSIFRSDNVVGAATTQPEETVEKIKVKTVKAKTNEDRLEFIQSFGWEVEADPSEVMEVVIPKEFDEVYVEYNNLQKKQGFDLEKYSGKRCKRYCYIVTNYPGTDEPVRVSLLIYKDKIIGGDVCSMESNGFMHGFEMQ